MRGSLGARPVHPLVSRCATARRERAALANRPRAPAQLTVHAPGPHHPTLIGIQPRERRTRLRTSSSLAPAAQRLTPALSRAPSALIIKGPLIARPVHPHVSRCATASPRARALCRDVSRSGSARGPRAGPSPPKPHQHSTARAAHAAPLSPKSRASGAAANARHQRRARTATGDKPCMRGKLIARPLHAVVMRGRRL